MIAVAPDDVLLDYGDEVWHIFLEPGRLACGPPIRRKPKRAALARQLPGRLCPHCQAGKRRPPPKPPAPPCRDGLPLVSNKPLREAFEESPIGMSELTRRMGYLRSGDYLSPPRTFFPDTSRVRRMLGLTKDNQQWLRQSTAKRLANALHLDPVDVGL